MPFIPVPPPSHHSESPRAIELSRRLREVIDNFRREHPDLKGREIRAATRLALIGSSVGGRSLLRLVFAGAALIAVALPFLLRDASRGGGHPPALAISAAVVLLGFVVAVARNRS